ncbi:ATP-binding protein [Methanococcoides methylutens]|uniref:ATP-binding protein n=1 Tax=Methanococcoides methylutens TaxID=2226 RepID=UPI0012E06C73|nr:ATP-binding protein [Methanococcoides methylutens]
MGENKLHNQKIPFSAQNIDPTKTYHFSTDHISYLEKGFVDDLDGTIDASQLEIKTFENVRILKIIGLTDFWKINANQKKTIHGLMSYLLSGLHEGNIPVLFGISGRPDNIEIFMGTFGSDVSRVEGNIITLKKTLNAFFEGISIKMQQFDDFNNLIKEFKQSGIVVSSPSYSGKISNQSPLDVTPQSKKNLELMGSSTEIDELLRGMYGENFCYLIYAIPVSNKEITAYNNMILKELRFLQESMLSHSATQNIRSPLGQTYEELLNNYLRSIKTAKRTGLWNSSIFLFTQSPETMNNLKAISKAVFGSNRTMNDRVQTLSLTGKLTKNGLIMNPPPTSPGQLQHPYAYMNTLNSNDLGVFINLPSQEMPGFSIKPYGRFKVSKQDTDDINITIGEILDRREKTHNCYKIPVGNLNKHGLIVGTTGSGKTNTLFFLLKDLWKKNKIPFLVIEPAKTEYRSLLFSEELKNDLKVFTLGDENTFPFRINPFEILDGVTVQTHIDLLKSVFNASFYMWGPLPHVLEQCLHEIYIDRGWNLASNTNRLGLHNGANPTLTDLYNKVDDVVDKLGYGKETTMEIKGSLKTRIDSMRIGGKGLMLDTRRTMPFETFLNKPTILELESLGDDDEKCFVMGLILTRMYEYYISKGTTEKVDLKHITVIEEAHRLLGTSQNDNPYVGNTRGKSVETFTNILAEIRAYGEGILISEQIPTKLAPDILKNTNLKIMHRIVAEDDRKAMSATMNILEQEALMVTTFSPGYAAVYSEGDTGAYYVKVPYSKIKATSSENKDYLIKNAMLDPIQDKKTLAPYEGCAKYCSNICQYKNLGRNVSRKRLFLPKIPYLILAMLDDAPSLPEILAQMAESGREEGELSKNAVGIGICALVHGLEYFFDQVSLRYQWSFEDREKIQSILLDFTIEMLKEYHKDPQQFSYESLDQEKMKEFNEYYQQICTGKQPTNLCGKICTENTCLYRYYLSKMLNDEEYKRRSIQLFDENDHLQWKQFYQKMIRELILPDISDDLIQKLGLCCILQTGFSKDISPLKIKILIENIIADYPDSTPDEENLI